MKNRSKRYKAILKLAIKNKKIDSKEALDLVKKNSTTKFDESIDVSLRINLKQSKGGDLSLRTVVNLPNGSGKRNRVAVLCEADKVDVAKKAGADVIKFQHHLPDEEMLSVVPRSKNFKVSLYDFLKKYSLKLIDHEYLKNFCKKKGKKNSNI